MAARVGGNVLIEATIGVDGKVHNARLVKSVAFLESGRARRRASMGVRTLAPRRRASGGDDGHRRDLCALKEPVASSYTSSRIPGTGPGTPDTAPVNEDKSTRYHRLRRRADLLGTATAGVVLLTLRRHRRRRRLREFGAAISQWVPETLQRPRHGHAGHWYGAARDRRAAVCVYQGTCSSIATGSRHSRSGTGFPIRARAAPRHPVRDARRLCGYLTLREWPDDWWWISAVVFALAMVGLAQLAPVLLLPIFYASSRSIGRRWSAPDGAGRPRPHRVVGVFEWVLSATPRKPTRRSPGWGGPAASCSPTRCWRTILKTRSRWSSRTSSRITCTAISGAASPCKRWCWSAGFFVASVMLTALADPLGLRGLGSRRPAAADADRRRVVVPAAAGRERAVAMQERGPTATRSMTTAMLTRSSPR